MTPPAALHRLAAALVLGLAVAAPTMAAPPILNPGQPVDFQGPLCLRESADGALELGVWTNPHSRSRAYHRLNVHPREFRTYPCPVAFMNPYEAPKGYFEEAAIVRIQGMVSSRIADIGYERYVDVHQVSSATKPIPQTDCPAFAKLFVPPAAKPMATLADTLYLVATELGGSDEDRRLNRISIVRLLRQGFGEKLAMKLDKKPGR